tara:strand:+ start:827 stop:1168 length:342 start_codon:yes stop_codon:yes gene_type:complete
MNEAIIKGEVIILDEIREYGSNGFRKREVVIKTGDEKYPNPIPVEFIKSAIESSQGLAVGQEVEIKGRLNGRDWTNPKTGELRHFLSFEALEVSFLADSGTSNQVAEDDDPPF